MRERAAVGVAVMGLYAVLAAMVAWAPVARQPEVFAAAIAFDLTVTAAGIVWWLGVRRGLLKPWVMVTVAGIGLLAARWMLPASEVKDRIVPIAAIVVEAAALVGATRSVRLRAAFRSELDAIGYGIGGWFRKAPAARAGAYSSIAGRPWAVLLGTFAFLLIAESAVLHVVIASVSEIAAWVATASSAYVLVWMAADYHALRLHPIEAGAARLLVRVGVRWRAEVAWANVASVERSEARLTGKDVLRGWVMRTDVLLTLREPVIATGPMGIRREVRRLALAVERPDAFVDDVRARAAAA